MKEYAQNEAAIALRQIPEPHCSDYVARIFDAKSADIPGTILKRSIRRVEQFASEAELINEVRRRGVFALRKTETHYEIINEARLPTRLLVEAQHREAALDWFKILHSC